MTGTSNVHLCTFATQPKVMLACGGEATPVWPADSKEDCGVYAVEDGRKYTFDPKLCTCTLCKMPGAVL